MSAQVDTQTERQTAPVDKRIERTGDDFTEGLCNGYLSYYADFEGKPVTDKDVFDMVLRNIIDVRGSRRFNAGYVVSWIEALIEDRDIFAEPDSIRR